MVTGNRFSGRFDGKDISNPFYIGNRLLALIQFLVNGVKLQDPLTGLRVVRWEILKGWNPKSESFDVEAELNKYVKDNGYQIKETPIHYRERMGKKKLKMRHGFTILKRIFLESISN